MAAAGVDASNVAPGHVVLLPEDPDASARALREGIAARAGVNVGVLVTDTAGRTWREGQTDLAVGAAGLRVLDDHAGRADGYGNELEVTAPAVADELAGAAELAAGKLGRRPFTVIRGRGDLVLPPGDHGPGAVGAPPARRCGPVRARRPRGGPRRARRPRRRPDGVRGARRGRRPGRDPDRPHRCGGAPARTARSRLAPADAARAMGGRGGGVRPWLGGRGGGRARSSVAPTCSLRRLCAPTGPAPRKQREAPMAKSSKSARTDRLRRSSSRCAPSRRPPSDAAGRSSSRAASSWRSASWPRPRPVRSSTTSAPRSSAASR